MTLGKAATTTPSGSVSTSGEFSVATVGFGLLNVMVSVETPPALMVDGLKFLLRAGALPVSAQTVTELPSRVTAPVRASRRPLTLAPVVSVMLA